MTATTRPTGRDGQHRTHLRFSSMESLGFDNPSSMWTESSSLAHARTAVLAPEPSKGRHQAEPDGIVAWQPQEVGRRLNGRDFRWSLLVGTGLLVAVAGVAAFWLYQQPARQAAASAAIVAREAAGLEVTLPALVAFNTTLGDNDSTANQADLFAVDAAARTLFDASADLDRGQAERRSAAAAASGAALDGIRLAGDTQAFQKAVIPILALPALETDPTLIALDEAARNFGEWQLRFDQVRTALPDGVLSDVTGQLDIISGELPWYMTRYVDALRADSQTEADAVLAHLGGRLEKVGSHMAGSIELIQQRVTDRVDEAITAIGRLLGS
ncbi:MAG TPA: hypothetical protein VFP42_06710 [Acidimicrobiia bacterium]|nr:hypothetical protein [Acidimicrobiia bacterium]